MIQDIENSVKKEYITNKDNLKGFGAAERFLSQLESMGGGFWISTAKNLHCYYKDKYLFYLYDFSRSSIKISEKYHSLIHDGTSDCSAHFFKLLKSKGNLDKLISITKSGYTLEIGNTDNAGKLFEMIFNAMQVFAQENEDVPEEQPESITQKSIAPEGVSVKDRDFIHENTTSFENEEREMFNNKEYFEVNREERHYGSLLISSIIHDINFREHFFEMINTKIRKPHYINHLSDIYTETAILRDYWHDLGNHTRWDTELLNRRRNIINMFLDHFEIDRSLIEKYPLFWTENKKLWSPGHWAQKDLEKIQKDNAIADNKLFRIRWAFNAKPDLLIISNANCIIIELKVESGIGNSQNGYNQIQTQQDIINLIKLSVPYFKNKNFEKIKITKEFDNGNISWSELLNNFSNEHVKKHFQKLIKEY